MAKSVKLELGDNILQTL